jgi:hypothetical protein
MITVVIGNLRWYVCSPSLYKLVHPGDYEIHLGFNGEVWYLAGNGHVVTVPDRETGAMLLAKQLNKQAADRGA